MSAKGTPDRAVVFIDGNNWFHGLDRLGEAGQKRLNYASISRKLLGPRHWVATRYYVGRVEQTGNHKLYADQRSFTARLSATDGRISVHYGRIEARPAENILADELLHYVGEVATNLDPTPARIDGERAQEVGRVQGESDGRLLGGGSSQDGLGR